MKKRKLTMQKDKRNKIGFQSSLSLYKEKFHDKEITFRPKFLITKNITFSIQQKIANNLAKPFLKIKPIKF